MPDARPSNPVTLLGPGGPLSFSRWHDRVVLVASGMAKDVAHALTLELVQAGANASFSDDNRWDFERESDARRAFEYLVSSQAHLQEVKLVVTSPGLPGPCEFYVLFKRSDGGGEEIRVTPALDFFRDEQRAQVPVAESWPLDLLKATEYEATPEWTAQWRITRAGLGRLLRGPLNPFVD